MTEEPKQEYRGPQGNEQKGISSFLVGAAIALAVLLVIGLWVFVGPSTTTQKKDFVQAVGVLLAGLVGLLGLLLTWRNQRLTQRSLEDAQRNTQEQIRLTEQGQITERFTRAIDQLGSTDDDGNPRVEIRLGGIYGLERIDKESPNRVYHSTVMEVLTAYVRENAPWPPTMRNGHKHEDWLGTPEGQDWIRKYENNLGTHKKEKGEYESWIQTTEGQMWLKAVREDESSKFSERGPVELPGGSSESDSTSTEATKRDKGTEQSVEPASKTPSTATEFRAILDVLNRREEDRVPEKHRVLLDLRETDLRKTNLSGARLQAALLNRAHLEEANLSGAHLEKANLSGAHLEKANLSGAHLQGTDLRYARLTRANLFGAYLEKAALGGADLEGANLLHAHLERANLQGAIPFGANLKNASLSNAHLEGADFGLAFLLEASLREAHLQGADLGGAWLTRANLSGAHFEVAYLVWARLEEAIALGAHLEEADLVQAHLQRANLFDAHLQRADLVEADLKEARLDGANLQGARLDRANLQGANLLGASLQGANLLGASLLGATLLGAMDVTSEQIEWTFGDEKTMLPDYLVDHRPKVWSKSREEQKQIITERLVRVFENE